MTLAKKLGYSTSATVSQWETDTITPATQAMKDLERLFGKFGAATEPEQRQQTNEPAEFGLWLKTERDERGLTLMQLSAKAGVNISTLSQIETGKIPTPQQKTRDKITKALGVRDADAPREVEAPIGLRGLGAFERFNPHDKEEWPKVNGIYVFYDITDRPTYIGRGKPISGRVRTHFDKKWYIEPYVSKAAYIQVDDPDLRKNLESLLIKFMQTNIMVNEVGVDREEE